MIMTRKIFRMTMLIMKKKWRWNTFTWQWWLWRRWQNSTDLKIICFACHDWNNNRSKNYMFCSTSVKNLYKKCKFHKIYSSKIYLQVGLKTATKKKRLIEEKAGCIYQNYKGYQNDEQKFLKKECDMRISRCVIPAG